MDQFIGEADLVRLCRTLGLAGQDDVERGAGTDEAGQAVAATGPGDDAELDLGQPELGLRVIRGHAPVTGQREFESAAQAAAVNGGHDRLAARGDTIHQLLRAPTEARGLFRGAQARELLDVGAGDEVVELAGDEHDGTHLGIVLEARQESIELLCHRRGKGVDRRAGHVERDDRDARLDFDSEGRHDHVLSSTSALPMPPCAQMEISPNCTSRRCISFASVVTMRAPVAPNG